MWKNNNMDDEQKEQLAKDAKQLQEDLKKRPKKIIRRKATIKFGGKKQPANSRLKSMDLSSEQRKEQDDFLRKQLGI